jgi:hypothetical protein
MAGAAIVAAFAAIAAADGPRGPDALGALDADKDGFVTRAEALAEADRVFGALDTDKDGKLTAADKPRMRHVFVHRNKERAPAPHAKRGKTQADHVIERDVRIYRQEGGEGTALAPVPLVPPIPHMGRLPMFLMMIMNSNEYDRDGDGALNKAEFLAQHGKMFDAADGNGDGKVKFEAPPEPPEPPEPTAPSSPR